MLNNCIICNNSFRGLKKIKGRKYCSRKCFGIGESKENHHFYGKKHSKKTRKQMSKSQIKAGNKPPIGYGKLNSNWKGGLRKITHRIRNTVPYLQWRQDVLIKNNFSCQKCEIEGGTLHVHHKKSFKKLLEEARKNLPLLDIFDAAMIYTPLWNVKNGITLCHNCHKRTKSYNRIKAMEAGK